MQIFTQNRLCPSQVLFAFDEVTNSEVNHIRWAIAYSTFRGCQRLVERVTAQMGNTSWQESSKQFITSLDFGLTDPAALEFLQSLDNSRVLIANPTVLDNDGLMPSRAYHPKIYLFGSENTLGYVAGSANLTESALISNTEVVIAGNETPDNTTWNSTWDSLLLDTIPLSKEIIDAYRRRRTRPQKRTVNPDPSIPLPSTSPRENPVFWEMVSSGSFNPRKYNHFWIEAGSMSSGGSRNQLELPRGSNQFFGFNHLIYEDEHITIGHPTITVRSQSWDNRPLTWHGNNKMERINLPTVTQGGYDYQNKAILFRRHEHGFEIKVANWDDANSLAWRSASESQGAIFRLGTRGNRICGFF